MYAVSTIIYMDVSTCTVLQLMEIRIEAFVSIGVASQDYRKFDVISSLKV